MREEYLCRDGDLLLRRRGLLLAATSLASLRLAAQPSPAQRAAVVIGVDRPNNLRPLRAAASGARKVSAWLRREGFDPVIELVDDADPVTVTQVFGAVRPIVEGGICRQLLIYFAGHGFINGYSEHWLLSGAPDNPNEAISLIESVALARQSGIPNVVFISDACRSRSDSIRTERVRGSLIFPNARSAPPSPSDVDQFLATLVGDPSWEVPMEQSSQSYEGVYTSTFLDAYRLAGADMVRTVGGFRVIPNMRLKDYLAREVPIRAARASVNLKQRPDSQVVAGELSYIARFLPDADPAEPPGDQERPDILTIAQLQLDASGLRVHAGGKIPVATAALTRATGESGFSGAADNVARARGLSDKVSARSGFSISGTHIRQVIAPTGVKTKFFNTNVLRPVAFVEVDSGQRTAASIYIEFESGDGTVLAALDGFIGNMSVDVSGVSNVSYIPARSSPLYESYLFERERLERLHAVVAASARLGVFRIEANRENRERVAENVADQIRMLKGVDPTLGLYAAYAYFDAGLSAQNRSVDQAMQFNLSGIHLFDTAMLAGQLQGRDAGRDTVPLGPMLSQGWSLLRVKGVRLSEELAAMRDNMRNALWLTLRPEGTAAAIHAVRTSQILNLH